MNKNLMNIQNHINFDVFCKLLQKDVAITNSCGLSIGVVVENELCSNKLLNNLEEVVFKKDNHLTLVMHAKHFKGINDLNVMIFENLLTRMMMTTNDEEFKTHIIDVLSSLEMIEDVQNDDLQEQLMLLFENTAHDNTVVFISNLHECDCEMIEQINALLNFYKACKVSFVISMNETMLHENIQAVCESSANPIDGFYDKMFERVYRLPNSIYTHSEEYFELLMDSSS